MAQVRTSNVGYALLALLAKTPNTAYELSQRVRRPLGYFWTAPYGQIHPQLRELAEAGLLSVETRPGPGPHDKRIYSITPAGRAELAEWVLRPPAPEPSRDEMLLKAYAIWVADPGGARAAVLAQAERHREQLAEYEAIQAEFDQEHPGAGPSPEHPDFGSAATLRFGIGYQRLRLEWCEWLASQLAAPQRPGSRGRRRPPAAPATPS
jgi:DNA-binding PadR family transcriptional regulator